MSAQKPVLPWHNEAALEIRRYFGKPLLEINGTDPVLPYILAKHDPHVEMARALEAERERTFYLLRSALFEVHDVFLRIEITTHLEAKRANT